MLGLAIVVFPPLKLLEATYCDEEDKGTALGKLYLWWGRGKGNRYFKMNLEIWKMEEVFPCVGSALLCSTN